MSGPGYSDYYDDDGQPLPLGEQLFVELFGDPFGDTTASEFEVGDTDSTG